jgi:hypothetical protein
LKVDRDSGVADEQCPGNCQPFTVNPFQGNRHQFLVNPDYIGKK